MEAVEREVDREAARRADDAEAALRRSVARMKRLVDDAREHTENNR
jgi:hypothetical protein